MKEFKGTKGKWRVDILEYRSGAQNVSIASSNTGAIAQILNNNPRPIEQKEVLANAQLISAAPELLEALQNVFVHAKTIINENHPDYKLAVKTINKALGK